MKKGHLKHDLAGLTSGKILSQANFELMRVCIDSFLCSFLHFILSYVNYAVVLCGASRSQKKKNVSGFAKRVYGRYFNLFYLNYFFRLFET